MKRRELDVDVVLWESLATPFALMNSEAPNKGELVGLRWRLAGWFCCSSTTKTLPLVEFTVYRDSKTTDKSFS